MYALCVSGAVNTRFCVEVFYALYINVLSFIHSLDVLGAVRNLFLKVFYSLTTNGLVFEVVPVNGSPGG